MIHQALLYDDPDELVRFAAPWLREGIAAAEVPLVVLDGEKRRAIERALGSDAGTVTFRDPADAFVAPARAIADLHRRVKAGSDAGRAVRVIGEPVWRERPRIWMSEWMRFEELLNTLFADTNATIVCSYHRRDLPPKILRCALETHPEVRAGEGPPRESLHYRPGGCPGGGSATETRDASWRRLRPPLSKLRRLVDAGAGRAGIDAARRRNLVLATHEIAANALEHSGGAVWVRLQETPDEIVVDVADDGHGIPDPTASYFEPPLGQARGRGLYLARQLTDFLEIDSSERGTVVSLHALRPASR